MKHAPVTIYHAAAIRDALGISSRPGSIAVCNGRVVAAGRPDELPRRLMARAQIVDRPGQLIMPAGVNAHAHLDLTAVGPRSLDGTFTAWLQKLNEDRPREPDDVAASIKLGAQKSKDAGVAHVGDVTPFVSAIESRRREQLSGVSYFELFGMGVGQRASLKKLLKKFDSLEFETPIPGWSRGVVLGLSPHAPYSAGPEIYEQATRLSRNRAFRVCTHLAETREEIEFCQTGTGIFREFLQSLDLWDDSIQPPAAHPVHYLEPYLRRGRWLLVHCNYVDDEHIEILQRSGTSVVYCPIASDYFGHTHHRYRDMLDQGVNVCLGTDSILCQPATEPQPLGVLAQMRYLYRRDKTDPQTLLAMATTHGMLALELSESDATLRKRAPACFAAVTIDPDDATDPLVQALENDHPVEGIMAI